MLKQFEMALQWFSKAFTFLQFVMGQQWLIKAFAFLQFLMALQWLSMAFTFLVENLDLKGKAKEEISYMWNCSENVKDLKRKNKKLKKMKRRVEQKIEAAKAVNGDRLLVGVEKWVVDAESLIAEAKKVIDEFEADANKTWFTRYTCGKKAVNMAASLLEHQKDSKTFESCVAVPTRAPGVLDSCESNNIDDLVTHKRCFEKIMESIKDDNIQIIGIYGMGGVGKTTLAKEVALEVKSSDDERIKKVVEFITVSQPVDVGRIIKELEVAAKRIKNGDKILVILDDLL